ncbi:MAG: 4Fe-4S binding protein, partial [Treponema sp.]|nr:4Fe-4S binding protein [Treponema sp.]
DMNRPADEWLHARYEGQEFQAKTCRFAANLLEKEGFPTVAPMTDPRYTSGNPRFPDKARQEHHTSNWSERHVAYACGLGTFGLSAGLITAKGVAGRFISLVTGARFEENRRFYAKFDEYCIHCGACVRNCPAKAISAEAGKSHPPCSEFLNSIGRQGVRYGCGKCQVNVPCENGIPFKNA